MVITGTILSLAVSVVVVFEAREQSKPLYSLTADVLITVITVK